MAAVVLTSVADPGLTVTVDRPGIPQPSRVRDVAERRWDGSSKPEVHRGESDYHVWEWPLTLAERDRAVAEDLVDFFASLDDLSDARFLLEVPSPVGSGQGPWVHTVALASDSVTQDFSSVHTATTLNLRMVEVGG